MYRRPTVDPLPTSRRARSRLKAAFPLASRMDEGLSSSALMYPTLKRPTFPVSFTPPMGSRICRVYTSRWGVPKISAPSRKNARFSGKKSAKRSLTVIWLTSASIWEKSGL